MDHASLGYAPYGVQAILWKPVREFHVNDDGVHALRVIRQLEREVDGDIAIRVPLPVAVALYHHSNADSKGAGEKLRR